MRRLIAALSALLVSGAPCLADSDPSLFFDTVDVQVVNVEAVVVDKDGHPVLGLGPEDFELYENGEPVEISNFFAVQGSEATEPSEVGQALPLGSSDAETSAVREPETQNLNLVILVDNAHVAPQNRNKIFVNLRKFLDESLRPDDRILIVSIGDSLKVETGLTQDRELIDEVISRLEKETGPSLRAYTAIRQLLRNIQSARIPGPAGGFADNTGDIERARLEATDYASAIRTISEDRLDRSKATLGAMAGFVSSLAGMKGRKALLYISDGMSMNPADALVQAWQDKYANWLASIGSNRDGLDISALSTSRYSLNRDLEKFVQHAAATKVAVYPITPGSLLARSVGSAESAGSMTTSGSGGASRLVGTLEQFALEESLLRMADETGGVAFTRTANIGRLLTQIRQDFSTFYSLGYQPSDIGDERRDLKIKVKNKEWKVRYGKTAQEKDPLENLQDRILSSLFYDLGENPLQISMTPIKEERTEEGYYQVSVMVQVPFEKILLLPEELHHSGRLTLFVVVRDEKNQQISPFRRVEIPLQIPNTDILQVMAQSAGYPLELNIEPGPKRIAIGIRDRLAQLDSTTFLELNVGSNVGGPEISSP